MYYAKSGIDKRYFDFMQKRYDSFSFILRKKKVSLRSGNYEMDEWYEDSIHDKVCEIVKLLNIDTVLVNYIFYSF